MEAKFKKSVKLNSVTLSAWSLTIGHFTFRTRVRGEKGRYSQHLDHYYDYNYDDYYDYDNDDDHLLDINRARRKTEDSTI